MFRYSLLRTRNLKKIAIFAARFQATQLGESGASQGEGVRAREGARAMSRGGARAGGQAPEAVPRGLRRRARRPQVLPRQGNVARRRYVIHLCFYYLHFWSLFLKNQFSYKALGMKKL